MKKIIICLSLIMLFAPQAQGEDACNDGQTVCLPKEGHQTGVGRLKTLKKRKTICQVYDSSSAIENPRSRWKKSAAGRHVAKAYEAMPPEDAATRLSGLDNETAVQILLKMESKKAGLVIGMMDSKATLLTKKSQMKL
jgi:flagellar motility protein MotE (MotC chaperone)